MIVRVGAVAFVKELDDGRNVTAEKIGVECGRRGGGDDRLGRRRRGEEGADEGGVGRRKAHFVPRNEQVRVQPDGRHRLGQPTRHLLRLDEFVVQIFRQLHARSQQPVVRHGRPKICPHTPQIARVVVAAFAQSGRFCWNNYPDSARCKHSFSSISPSICVKHSSYSRLFISSLRDAISNK